MKDIYDLKVLCEKAEKLHFEMLKQYRESGRVVDEEHTKKFNALAFAVANAADELEKGLKGEF